MVEDRLLYHNLEMDDYTEFLKDFIPLFGEKVPEFILELFRDLKKIFSVGSNGFGGTINETVLDGIHYMEYLGYDGDTIEPYVRLYRDRLNDSLRES